MNLAPILLFCYNRPLHLLETLNALKGNELSKNSKLYIFADGPKDNATEKDLKNISEVDSICNSIKGFFSVEVNKSPINIGLQNSVIKGLNYVLGLHENVIVIEDDVVTSPYFLTFMNDALFFYKNNTKILSIGSWNYYYNTPVSFFNHMPDTIAWATWKNRWDLFEQDGEILLNKLIKTGLISKFNLNGKFDFENMLRAQINGKVSSWAIRWTAVAVLNDTLTLYPKDSLSKHIGFGKDSTNCEAGDFNKDLKLANESISNFEIEVIENVESLKSFINFEMEIKTSQNNLEINKVSLVDNIRSKLSKYIPNSIKGILRKKKLEIKLAGWFGNYQSWDVIEKKCTGYDANVILDTVKAAVLKVRNGEAIYERDSVLFDEIEYSQPLLNAFTQSILNNTLHIVDFGGSLGSSYFQNRNQFSKQLDLKWSVVEQQHFVEVGKNEIAIDHLSFFNTVQEALKEQKNQVLFLSSVIPYFKEPYALINKMLEYNFEYIIIDRTAFIEGDNERITKQIVPEFIYKATYPAWFLNEKKFINAFSEKYELLNDFMSAFDPEDKLEDGLKVYRKGFYFKKKI